MPYQFLHFAGGSSAATAQPPAVPSSFEVMRWCWAMGRCITAPAGGFLLRESFTIRNSSAMKKLIVLSYFQWSICRVSDPSFPGGPTAWFPPIRGLLQLGNDSLCCCSAVGWSSWTVWRGAKWQHRRCWELQIGHGGLQWFAVPKQRGWASAECGRAAGLHMNHTLFTWFRFSSYELYHTMIASIFLHVVVSHLVAARMHDNPRPPTWKSGHYLEVAKEGWDFQKWIISNKTKNNGIFSEFSGYVAALVRQGISLTPVMFNMALKAWSSTGTFAFFFFFQLLQTFAFSHDNPRI